MAELYYDRYEGDSAHKRAGYTKILAKAGYVEQSAEFNEVQSIARDYIERLGDSLYKDGYIVTGCTININADRTRVALTDGKVYLEGLIRMVNGVTLSITGQGTERIIAKVITSVITVDNDRSLYDPAQNAENYGLPGADRRREIVQLSVVQGDNTDGGAELYHLEDGVVVNEDTNDDNAYIMGVLAERTFDENGSYKVNGLNIRNIPELDEETNKIKVYITAGKAYVYGYSVTKPAMSVLYLEPSLDRRRVTSESHYYNSMYDKYELSNGPVAVVSNLTCLVSAIGERKFRGSVHGGYDPLNNVPVDSIVQVYTLDGDGNIAKIYRQNRDYKLYNDQVDWSLTGDDAEEPEAGTTYYVDYVYNKTMVQGVDFDIENSASTAYLKFLSGGAKPDENSRMYISYEYTLARRDLILLDRDGHLSVIQGKPDRLPNLLTPYNGSDRFLELGYVDIYPTDELQGVTIEGLANIKNYSSVRMTQQDFYVMLQRIDNLEDGMAELDMERDFLEGEDDASLNGFFTDNFKNINKSDISYTGVDPETGDDIRYTASIDYDMEELTTSLDIFSKDLIINDAESSDYATYGRIISAPYEYELAVRQKYATGTMLVNPYASYGPMCKVELNPAIDNWVDEAETTVYNTVTNTAYHSSTVYRGSGNRSSSSTSTSYAGTTTSHVITSSVAESVYEFMRGTEVEVIGRAFSGNMTDIHATFNEIPVSLTPANSTTNAGNPVTVGPNSYGTVDADENGSFNAKFKVPTKDVEGIAVPCGSVDVILTGTNEIGEEYSGRATYSASGTLLTTTIVDTTVITSHYNVLTTVTSWQENSDPLAQSFVMSTTNDRVLMKLGLYFATVSPTRPAVVQVRNMVNGYPGKDVYAQVIVDQNDINLPTDPNVPVVTEVVLNQPVYCKAGVEYCFVIMSDSNAYSMYYAEMGNRLLGSTDEDMIINPYATGVMFSSSNASTWTAHQGADLKFELYRSRYTGRGEIIFDHVSHDEVTGVFLDAAYQDNHNDGLDWYYKYKMHDGTDSVWLPIDTLTYRELRDTTSEISLKAIINTDFSTSPYIDIGRVTLRSMIDKKTATYISEHVTADDFEDPYQALKLQYQVALPTGSDHKIYYMDDYNGEWVEVKTSEYVTLTTKIISEEFTQYTWDISKVNCMILDPTSPGATFFKLRIDLNTTLAYNRPRVKKLSAIFKYEL